MKLSIISLLVLAQALQSSAYPWMAGAGAGSYDASVHKRAEAPPVIEKRGLLGGALGGVLGGVGSAGSTIISGVTGAVGDLVNGLASFGATNVGGGNVFPDAAHPFQAPGSTDQRGVCPGLNALANHGYLPRNGIVTAKQVIQATGEVFNMGEDLSALLSFIAITFGGNLETQTFSIGGEDARTYSASGIGSKAAGRHWGLDAHSRCEGDVSPTRDDFYTANGDNHSQRPDRFKRLLEIAKKHNGEFNIDAVNELYGQNAELSLSNNPKLYMEGYTLVVILAAYPIIPEFFSNGTYGAGGAPTLENIAPLMGFKINDDGSLCAVPEQIPANWYRRSTPYGIANVVANAPDTFASGRALPSPISNIIQSGNADEIGCFLYQLLSSESPASVTLGTTDGVSSLLTGLQNQLLGGLPTIFGCSGAKGVNGSSNPAAFDDSLQAQGPGGDQVLTCI